MNPEILFFMKIVSPNSKIKMFKQVGGISRVAFKNNDDPKELYDKEKKKNRKSSVFIIFLAHVWISFFFQLLARS